MPACLLSILPVPHWNGTHACSFGWQGAGLYIDGTATLTNINVYSNEGTSYCGGVLVGSNGVANFVSCNIHDNTAAYMVRLHL